MAMRRLLLLQAAAAAAVQLSFEPWKQNYVHVTSADTELECKESSEYVMQLDPDSVLVEGAVSGRPKPLADYGVGPTKESFDRLIFESGMFIPELDPCWYTTNPSSIRGGGLTAGRTTTAGYDDVKGYYQYAQN